ncbi:MAG: hypothetical protein KGL04_07200 [Elusimicrobia bacterium]|nr:hypothetical protein [Elusimicrobiota bacterium]
MVCRKASMPVFAAVLVTVCLAFSVSRSRGAGYPDINFTGYQATPLESPLGGSLAAGYAVAPDDKGDILVAGALSDASGAVRMAVLRFERDGTLDKLFGSNGVYAPAGPRDWGTAMAVDEEGRVMIAGSAGQSFGNSQAVVLRRLLPTGLPDPMFAKGGMASAAGPFGGRAMAYAVALQGRDILVGGAATGPDGRLWGALWRFDHDGDPEKSFGRGGVVLFPAPPRYFSQVRALVPLADGSVLAAGNFAYRMAIWKTEHDGRRDDSFGRHGLALGPFGWARALAPGAGGALWLAGFRTIYNRVTRTVTKRLPALVLMTALGGVDAGFGRAGIEYLQIPDFSTGAQIFALAADPQGGLYAAGDAGAAGKQACLWALGADGRPNPAFGSDGVLLLPHSTGGVDERAYALAFDRHGRILATGISRDKAGAVRLALWRALPAR